MISNVVGFFLIAFVVTLFMLFGELLQWLFSPRQEQKVRLSHALDDLFLQGGQPKHSTRHAEHILVIHFLWMMLGNIVLFCSTIYFNWALDFFPLVAILSLFLALWWSWRQGILR